MKKDDDEKSDDDFNKAENEDEMKEDEKSDEDFNKALAGGFLVEGAAIAAGTKQRFTNT